MPDPVETERLGAPYWQCPECAYSANDRGYVAAHMRDHEPRRTLDELLAAAAAPEPAPAKPGSRRSRP
jgi:hypothetical protein